MYRPTRHRPTRIFISAMLTALATAALTAALAGEPQGSLDAADAQEPPQLYQVEIVVFRALSPLGVAEDWNAQSAQVLPADDEAAPEEPAADPQILERPDVQQLPPAQFRLAGTEAALRRSAGYQVLAHVAWSQPTTPRGADIVHTLGELGVDNPDLRGTVALEQGRYMYLNLDLAWTPEDPPSSLLGATSGAAPVTFTLREKRRLRPSEQHYLDHPAFGVIAIVSPLTPTAD